MPKFDVLLPCLYLGRPLQPGETLETEARDGAVKALLHFKQVREALPATPPVESPAEATPATAEAVPEPEPEPERAPAFKPTRRR